MTHLKTARGFPFRSEGLLVTTPNSQPCIARSLKICFCLSVITVIYIISARAAHAIPSPELVLGSVSSLSQILAVVVATVSGFGAIIASRLGLKSRNGNRRYPAKTITALVLVAAGLGFANHWQWQQHKSDELQRLQATLVRPAQFDGTEIKDATLKETSYTAQETHPQGITTTDAARLLGQGRVKFYDIRETAENAMGTLPGATHVRFPDFRQSPPVAPGDQVVLFCHNGNRSSETCAELAKLGIDCRFISGGIEKWIVEGRPFSDSRVQSLSDLRAIPEYPNKSRLLSTADFTSLINADALQIVDTRYPGDFETGHLPGAINIPLRALTTEDLEHRIAQLRDVPTVAACYDRRSCFMSQVLGLELTQAGIPFEGRYTVPWEYFVAPAPKPHVANWLSEQQTGLWDRAVQALSDALLWGHNRAHFLVSLLVLALMSRVLVLPIALKSERDQITLRAHKPALEDLKSRLAHDPMRKARAIRAFYADLGLTPMRNMAALLFLPVMMLGLQAAEHASGGIKEGFLWISDLGAPDPTWIAPVLTCLLAGVYLLLAIAKSRRSGILWVCLGVPALFVLTMGLSAAGNLYLCISLLGLLAQYLYVSGTWARSKNTLGALSRLPTGVVKLSNTPKLSTAGNKAYRLSQLAQAGFPVPKAVVLTTMFLTRFQNANARGRDGLARRIWTYIEPSPCAVRSSASNEDGADQSFAGVFDSVLDVRQDTLRAAIDTVLASFTSERAGSYQATTAGHANILVQEMINATYAGVLFTQDPQAPGMMLIEWVEGCGEDLVSGRKTPGTARFGRISGHAAPEVQEPPFDVQALLKMGRSIEALFEQPQDVEWAWADGEFYILQSRDITTVSVGSSSDQASAEEWRRLFATEPTTDPEAIILEQDEMSEVLPRPTPLSFSLMGRLWAPGGSLDLASRALGLPYQLPEGENAHLVRLFGKTYVDTRLKKKLVMDLGGNRATRLRKQLRPTLDGFERQVLPALRDRVENWQAIRFDALSQPKLLAAITELQAYFVTDIYVEAEKINLLAAFAMQEATAAAQGDPALRSHLMQADLTYSPASLLAQCTGSEDEAQARALDLMGHRAMFDYELSTPRYLEAPGLLFSLLDASAAPLTPEQLPDNVPTELKQTIEMAIAFQDLKERAKHESLRVLAELRRALLALGAKSKLGALVFHLTLDEVLQGDWDSPEALHDIAQARKTHDKLCHDQAPTAVQLSLLDCEQLSAGAPQILEDGALGGTCVAGSGTVTGQVFRVTDETAYGDAAFEGFTPGDILVCHMLNPAWLPQVQQAGAVVSVVGGWLSHMAIVAREKNILMLVGAQGVDGLSQGQTITVTDAGVISTEEDQARERSA
ncbi:PEP/pyruvate-binding domain-containing protein [Tritonibacter scottomollicae]|uniref:Rhodanese-like domain-containing protein n=1 Tax=Tritonibacter scottomollicae TaxID=483013 RepID=A0A2T1AC39_TRISK|nr:PEP/pyruvate-binding domain-containing protein [Tritonibacter scottomollicae]PRZ46163.1 rhodanese-like domain-containing protein [Tritonibacter scottomollicae]